MKNKLGGNVREALEKNVKVARLRIQKLTVMGLEPYPKVGQVRSKRRQPFFFLHQDLQNKADRASSISKSSFLVQILWLVSNVLRSPAVEEIYSRGMI